MLFLHRLAFVFHVYYTELKKLLKENNVIERELLGV